MVVVDGGVDALGKGGTVGGMSVSGNIHLEEFNSIISYFYVCIHVTM